MKKLLSLLLISLINFFFLGMVHGSDEESLKESFLEKLVEVKGFYMRVEDVLEEISQILRKIGSDYGEVIVNKKNELEMGGSSLLLRIKDSMNILETAIEEENFIDDIWMMVVLRTELEKQLFQEVTKENIQLTCMVIREMLKDMSKDERLRYDMSNYENHCKTELSYWGLL